jgi:hypothetical protein
MNFQSESRLIAVLGPTTASVPLLVNCDEAPEGFVEPHEQSNIEHAIAATLSHHH